MTATSSVVFDGLLIVAPLFIYFLIFLGIYKPDLFEILKGTFFTLEDLFFQFMAILLDSLFVFPLDFAVCLKAYLLQVEIPQVLQDYSLLHLMLEAVRFVVWFVISVVFGIVVSVTHYLPKEPMMTEENWHTICQLCGCLLSLLWIVCSVVQAFAVVDRISDSEYSRKKAAERQQKSDLRTKYGYYAATQTLYFYKNGQKTGERLLWLRTSTRTRRRTRSDYVGESNSIAKLIRRRSVQSSRRILLGHSVIVG